MKSDQAVVSLYARGRDYHKVIRSRLHTLAVELEEKAAAACQFNMVQSPWADRLSIIHSDIQDFCQQTQYYGYFDHIICNPPYFEHGPKANDQHRAMARHTDTLGFEPLLKAISQCLSPEGSASLILPIQSLIRFKVCLNQFALYLRQEVQVKSVENKAANRVLLLLSKTCIGFVNSQVAIFPFSKTSFFETMQPEIFFL